MKSRKATPIESTLSVAGDQAATPPTGSRDAHGVQSWSPSVRNGRSGNSARRSWEIAGICILLGILVFAVFGQTVHFDFVNFDDDGYVYQNPVVLNGLSVAGIQWAFTHVLAGHWHPLTVILLMVLHHFFGLWPGGYHLTNVFLHASCVVFLFLVLLEMTGALWQSAFVATVFAVHPLRAESVAWISECKDVLSGLFFILTLLAYVRYVRLGSRGHYAMVLLWFALGLMSKSMLVTLPCVLLLLDYWPLARLRTAAQFPKLLFEKVPLFILSAISSIAAILALRSGRGPISSYPGNAPIAYVTYIAKFFYPTNLAVLYPLPVQGWPLWDVFDAILLLLTITAAVWYFRRGRPYLVTGWFWYMGMLVPVIGVMQTGNDAWADRYTYLPEIGLILAATWLSADLLKRRPYGRAILSIFSTLILCVLTFVARGQVAYWHDSISLWTHALDVTGENYVAHDSLGVALFEKGFAQEAVSHFREAIHIDPAYPNAHFNLGNTLLQQGHVEQAITECSEAARLDPSDTDAYAVLGLAMERQGHLDKAVAEYRKALLLNPADAEVHNNLGFALSEEGRVDDAIAEYREAIRINPEYAKARGNLAIALSRRNLGKQLGTSASVFSIAPRIMPIGDLPGPRLQNR